MGVILETNQLCKFYGTGENQVKAVNHVNIQIEQGEFVAIVGKSGSGKSTLLHMLGGLDTPTSGSVILSDKDLYSMKEDQLAVFRRRKIGFVFQAFNLVSSINVWENIVLPLGLDGKKVDKAYVNDIITTLGLEHRIHNLPNTLSGGQQQRVALARALVLEPKVLLLDEPLSALDMKLRQQMQVELKQLQRDLHITFVFVTHDQQEAMVMSDRIAVFNKGRVQQIGTPAEIYNHPANSFVASFVGTMNFIPETIVTANGFSAGSYTVRPERIVFVDADDNPDMVTVEGQVTDCIYLGTEYRILIKLTTRETFTVVRPVGETVPERGENIRLAWRKNDQILLEEH